MSQDQADNYPQPAKGIPQRKDKDALSDIIDGINARSRGMSLEEFRADMALTHSLHREGRTYYDLPPAEWPTLTFNWDLSRSGQRFGLDAVTEPEFLEMHPRGLLVGHIPLLAFDCHLAYFSRRDTLEELWGLGRRVQLAGAIAYLRRGLPISPPIVSPAGAEVILKGGHHRYAIAKAVNLETIPLLVAPEDGNAVGDILGITWENPPSTT